MKQVLIDVVAVMEEAKNEDQFFDMATIEALYMMRQLRAIIEFGQDFIEVEEDCLKDNNQVRLTLSDSEQIWMPIRTSMEID